jgi:hypothetical protein
MIGSVLLCLVRYLSGVSLTDFSGTRRPNSRSGGVRNTAGLVLSFLRKIYPLGQLKLKGVVFG